MALRIQKPTEGYDWLYQDRGENDRYFTDIVYLGKHENPWPECTQAERDEWESVNKPAEESIEQESDVQSV